MLEGLPQAFGCHAVREERGDECPGARADVEVEIAGGEPVKQRVEREKRADLVEPADHAAAGEHERVARRSLRIGPHGFPRGSRHEAART